MARRTAPASVAGGLTLVFACASGAVAQGASASTAAASAAGGYRSAFDGYQRHAEQPVLSWREANDTVRSIGGWRAYAREAAGATAAAEVGAAAATPVGTAAAASVPAPAARGASPSAAAAASAPAANPHAGHVHGGGGKQ